MHLPVTPYRPADFRLSLEYQYLPAGVGQPVGCDQSVVPGTDDHGVDLARQFLGAHLPIFSELSA
jgi:hypothetical protein